MTRKVAPLSQLPSTDRMVVNEQSASTLYDEYRLANGLRVILHQDHGVPVVAINVLYHVGSKDEEPGRTGFAHLFEHLMFDGSRNVPRGDYDRYCTMVGGDNNAFTTPDLTDYHITLPGSHLALGLWLESDRMAGFAIEEESLETQKNVVIEEKKQTQDDVPYGDASSIMRELSYDPQHPYSWDTIGSVEDVRGATMEDVRRFYERFYVPRRARLTIAGDFDRNEAIELVEAYYGDIVSPSDELVTSPSASELALLRRQGERRRVRRDILPFNGVFMGWHAPALGHRDLRALDILGDVLAEGESSRFYRALEYEKEIASEADFLLDEGELGSMIYLYAVGSDRDVTVEDLEEGIMEEISRVARKGVTQRELQKVIHRKATRIAHSLQSISNRSERLALFSALYGDPMLAFREADMYASITADDVQRVASEYMTSFEPSVVEYEFHD